MFSLIRQKYFALVVSFILVIFFWVLYQISTYSAYGLLGILGALFANATGAGGGIIFIPAFQQLGITAEQSVATSFAIQCFGMTTGSVMWLTHAKKCRVENWSLLPTLSFICIPFSILGIWSVYGLGLSTPGSLSYLFAYFSIFIGLGLLYTGIKKIQSDKSNLMPKEITVISVKDKVALVFLSYVGGIITAWLSVGVGEIIAFYLIYRGYRVTLAIAVAVVLSAFSVWAGIGYHLYLDNVYWNVLLFAGPGAVIGGILAKKLATSIPVFQLKMFFASWVFIAGTIELLIN
ncbi:MAG: putative membrane protein YfcA [Psychrosphaera sp.]